MKSLVDRMRAIVEPLPDGASVTLPATAVRDWLTTEPKVEPIAIVGPSDTWREKLWTCAADVRLGVRELAEAMDRSPDWVYRATSQKHATEHGRNPLPCSRLDGALVFTAGAVRDWVRASELVVNPATPHLRSLSKK